jgi:hypothetical protein
VVGFESQGLTTVENGIDKDGQADQAFGIHVNSFISEKGRESTNLLHAFPSSDSDATIIAEISRQNATSQNILVNINASVGRSHMVSGITFTLVHT